MVHHTHAVHCQTAALALKSANKFVGAWSDHHCPGCWSSSDYFSDHYFTVDDVDATFSRHLHVEGRTAEADSCEPDGDSYYHLSLSLRLDASRIPYVTSWAATAEYA